MSTNMSNRERLEDAGILDPNQNLTEDQLEAIDQLSGSEVDGLISIKNKLEDLSRNAAGGPVQPGINPIGFSEEPY